MDIWSIIWDSITCSSCNCIMRMVLLGSKADGPYMYMLSIKRMGGRSTYPWLPIISPPVGKSGPGIYSSNSCSCHKAKTCETKMVGFSHMMVLLVIFYRAFHNFQKEGKNQKQNINAYTKFSAKFWCVPLLQDYELAQRAHPPTPQDYAGECLLPYQPLKWWS